ncbi:MAG: DUF1292 domain-containing protein [Acutalibacteraceae bacterium]|jgi:uncharacterized protein YrzB (UPF0473 family)|nr:DUF1292 domain-containing protein [Clostridia bacterium]MEE1187541.1 DUF1292 domain-containing protein [Acutalibacteraceae bacterium]
MNNENLIVLYDEDGNEVPFEFLDYIEYDHCNYVALLPLEGDMENAEVLILQVVENEDGEQDFDIVEDTKLLARLYRQFQDDHRDEFNFRD